VNLRTLRQPPLADVVRRSTGTSVAPLTLMSELLPDADGEVVVKLPEDVSLDDLIAGLEASWPGPAAPGTQPDPPTPCAHEPLVSEVPQGQERRGPERRVAERRAADRRGADRRAPHEFTAELRLAVAGFRMQLVNLSSTGLLAETNHRLCPGRTVDVFLRYGSVRKVLRATVIRSFIHAVVPNPVFRAALQFEDTLALPDADL
jgi:hypothetical protein